MNTYTHVNYIHCHFCKLNNIRCIYIPCTIRLAETASGVFITLDMLLTAKQERAPSSDLERLQMVILVMLNGRPSACTPTAVDISTPHGTELQRAFGIGHDVLLLTNVNWDWRSQALLELSLESFIATPLEQNVIELFKKRLLKAVEAFKRF